MEDDQQIRYVGGPYGGEIAPRRSPVLEVLTVNTETGERRWYGIYRYDGCADLYRWEDGSARKPAGAPDE